MIDMRALVVDLHVLLHRLYFDASELAKLDVICPKPAVHQTGEIVGNVTSLNLVCRANAAPSLGARFGGPHCSNAFNRSGSALCRERPAARANEMEFAAWRDGSPEPDADTLCLSPEYDSESSHS